MIPRSHYTYYMKEEWKEIKHKKYKQDTIVAVSNFGKLKLHNGEIVESKYRQHIRYNGKHMKIHRLIALLFIPKTQEDIINNRDIIDHITHEPKNMNINDVRNLRWCTTLENNNFKEAIENKRISFKKRSKEWSENISKGRKGIVPWNKGVNGEEYLKHFKNGINNQFTIGG